MELAKQWYGRKMARWEHQLATKSTDRVVRPFDWGVEWMRNWPFQVDEADAEKRIVKTNRLVIGSSQEFFDYEVPRDVALCKGIAELGISVLRISLPYHDKRMPPELGRADYAVSANVARTIDATRQAVIDVRACYDWLQSQGYDDLGIVGTSLGSCYAFLASAHDPRIRVNVFNHCSTYFADVVWTGLSTRHIRQGIEGNIDVDRLRAVWDCVSPVHYMDRYADMAKKSFFLYATYDTTFPLHLSRQIVDHIQARGVAQRIVAMPCGHYTLGEAPFKFIAGYEICSFLKRNL